MTLSHAAEAVFSGYSLLDNQGVSHLPVVPHQSINEEYHSAHEVI
jgi:hypothetical protein